MELPEHNLGFLLHDVARLMRKRFEQKARGLGLTRSQYSVLAHLARNEGIQQGGLAEILEVEPITLTRILDRLEEAELVERRAHPKDRRIRLLHLTRKAHPLLGEIFAIGAATRGEGGGAACESRPSKDPIRLSSSRSPLAPAWMRSTSKPTTAGCSTR